MKNNTPSSPQKASWPRRFGTRGAIGVAALCLASFAAGWLVKDVLGPHVSSPQPLRLASGSYQFINPLLSCNFSALNIFPQDQAMNGVVTSVINGHKAKGDIAAASAYFADFLTSKFSSTNSDLKFYPSSITKIPIMMAYYELAESSNSILNQKITYPVGSEDVNASQETKPAVPLVPGQTYTVENLIERMIKYSDNNAAALLYEAGDRDTITDVYNNLQIPTEKTVTADNLDFITPQQISTLFRVLYNATYLSRDYSEKALALLSQTDFTQGLVAGVPSGTTVSHKFGIVRITTNGVETSRELHDCGIFYAPNHPYLLCVMTRGSATSPGSLSAMQSTIADVSTAVYNQVEKNGD
jgi:beta-lactamase class A